MPATTHRNFAHFGTEHHLSTPERNTYRQATDIFWMVEEPSSPSGSAGITHSGVLVRQYTLFSSVSFCAVRLPGSSRCGRSLTVDRRMGSLQNTIRRCERVRTEGVQAAGADTRRMRD